MDHVKFSYASHLPSVRVASIDATAKKMELDAPLAWPLFVSSLKRENTFMNQ
jgi:hypothetical protein